MLDTYENYIGKVIENERTRRGLSVNDSAAEYAVKVSMSNWRAGNMREECMS